MVFKRKYSASDLLKEADRNQPTTNTDGEFVIDLLPQSLEDGQTNKLPIEFAHLHVKSIHEQSAAEDGLNHLILPHFTIATFRYSAKGQVSQPISVIKNGTIRVLKSAINQYLVC